MLTAVLGAAAAGFLLIATMFLALVLIPLWRSDSTAERETDNADVTADPGAEHPPEPEKPMEPREVFAAASPSVVQVIVFGGNGQTRGRGTGFCVSHDGLIVTNHHVVEDGQTIFIRAVGASENQRVERVLGSDREADLAVLKVDASPGPPLDLADDVLPVVGSSVYAIGNPQGFTNSLSEGLVSGHRVRSDGVLVLQTTAAISRGSSGGPLLNEYGDVIGVTTYYWREGQSLNFAVPALRVRRLVAKCSPDSPLRMDVARSYRREALQLHREQRFDEAVRAYLAALEMTPDSAELYLDLGQAYVETGNMHAAYEAFKNAAELARDMGIAEIAKRQMERARQKMFGIE
jgi:S1-C subfamily serine protease